jgi:predicted DNA-binding protein (MmcQ/YjbR family)
VTLAQYNAFCKALPHVTHVVQWGGAHVWKVGGKVFAIAGWEKDGDPLAITFKCSPMSFELLKQEPGCRPAPYLASRGLLWIQRVNGKSLNDMDLKTYLKQSHRLAAATLPKKTRTALGLEVPIGGTPIAL